MVNENTWRVYARLTQRFGAQGAGAAKSTSNIKNAFYTLQVGYTKYKGLPKMTHTKTSISIMAISEHSINIKLEHSLLVQ